MQYKLALLTLLVYFSFLFPSARLNAQSRHIPMETDRPDQTECASTVPALHLQGEHGFSIEVEKLERHYRHPSSLLRFGVSDRVELRLAAEPFSGGHGAIVHTSLAPVELGFKVALFDEHGWVPQTAFIGHLNLGRLATKDEQVPFTSPAFRFALAYDLGSGTGLGINLGSEMDGRNATMIFLYTIAFSVDLDEHFGAYVEIYGDDPEGSHPASHSFDGGLTLLVSPNLQFDVSGGVGLVDIALDYFAGVGVSWRLPR